MKRYLIFFLLINVFTLGFSEDISDTIKSPGISLCSGLTLGYGPDSGILLGITVNIGIRYEFLRSYIFLGMSFGLPQFLLGCSTQFQYNNIIAGLKYGFYITYGPYYHYLQPFIGLRFDPFQISVGILYYLSDITNNNFANMNYYIDFFYGKLCIAASFIF